jgi:proliferating cell nuclear antigen
VSEFELKLLSIDSETLDVPNQDYHVVAKMPCHAFQDIIKDMQSIGETVQISALKGQLKFATYGDVANAHVCLRCEGRSRGR